jgi:hypothetical protein
VGGSKITDVASWRLFLAAAQQAQLQIKEFVETLGDGGLVLQAFVGGLGKWMWAIATGNSINQCQIADATRFRQGIELGSMAAGIAEATALAAPGTPPPPLP